MSGEELSSIPFRQRKAWAITIRPKNGITDADINMFKNFWLNKLAYKNRLYAVTEMDGDKRHIHGVFLTRRDNDLRQDNLKRALNTILKRSFGERFSRHTLCLKHVFNKDWEKVYCAKEMKDNIIIDTIGNYDDFLPSAEEQLEAINSKKSKVTDHYFHNLCELWEEYNYKWNDKGFPLIWKVDALNFLKDMMYGKKRISVIRDKKCRVAVAEAFRDYQRGSWDAVDDLTKEELEQYRIFQDALSVE